MIDYAQCVGATFNPIYYFNKWETSGSARGLVKFDSFGIVGKSLWLSK